MYCTRVLFSFHVLEIWAGVFIVDVSYLLRLRPGGSVGAGVGRGCGVTDDEVPVYR